MDTRRSGPSGIRHVGTQLHYDFTAATERTVIRRAAACQDPNKEKSAKNLTNSRKDLLAPEKVFWPGEVLNSLRGKVFPRVSGVVPAEDWPAAARERPLSP